jgi:hypothetical protein
MNDQTSPALDALASAIKTAIDAATADRLAYEQALATANASLADALAKAADLQKQLDDVHAASDPWFKVEKTGAVEVTDAINAFAAKGGIVKPPPGVYLVDAVKAVQLKVAGTKLDLSAGAKLIVKPNSAKKYGAVVASAPDCAVIGGEIVGDRDQHVFDDPDSTDEFGHCIVINKGADRFQVIDTICRKGTGDGIKVNDGVRGVVIEGALCDENRRQGISIVHAYDITIRDTICSNTNGTSPQAGIDLEPMDGQEVRGVTLERVTLTGNGYGMNVQNSRVSGVNVIDSNIVGNRSRGAMVKGGTDINFTGGTIGQNGAIGLAYSAGTSGKVAGVKFDRNVVAKHPKGRTPPIVKAGIVRNTVDDLTVNSVAKVDLSVPNTYA